MARKPKPYVVFETKEEFDKMFDKIRYDGRVEGFRDGSIWLLSYVQELFHDMFKPETFASAENEIRTRNIERWRRDHNHKTLKAELDFQHELDQEFHDIILENKVRDELL